MLLSNLDFFLIPGTGCSWAASVPSSQVVTPAACGCTHLLLHPGSLHFSSLHLIVKMCGVSTSCTVFLRGRANSTEMQTMQISVHPYIHVTHKLRQLLVRGFLFSTCAALLLALAVIASLFRQPSRGGQSFSPWHSPTRARTRGLACPMFLQNVLVHHTL